jgi:uncharacterized membrane protein YczE
MIITKREIVVKIGLNIISAGITGLGIVLFLKSKLGSDPITVWVDGLHHTLKLPYGNASIMYNAIFLIIAVIFARKYIFIGTVIASLGCGLFLNWFDAIIPNSISGTPFLNRLGVVIIGEIILCLGMGLTTATRFGVTTVDAICFAISEKSGIQYRWLRISADFLYTLCGVLMGGIIGIGTVLSIVLTGNLMVFMMKFYNRTILKYFKISDSLNELQGKPINDN